MLKTIKGVYEQGRIIMQEEPPVSIRTEVFITFLTREQESGIIQKRMPGGLRGKVNIPDDFNDPLEDLRGYI